MEKEFDSTDLINWGELSRLLAGNRSSITKKRIPKKHAATIDRLKELIKIWDDERRSSYNAS
jgi:hypothetical protein